MRKDKLFIEQERRYARLVKEIQPKLFASVALSLRRRHGFGQKRIQEVLADVSELMMGHSGEELLRMCSDECDITIISSVTEKEAGIKGDYHL